MAKDIPISRIPDSEVSRVVVIDVSDIIHDLDMAFKSIDFFEYDLEELFTLLLTQLRWSSHYPNSYVSLVEGVMLDGTFKRVYSLMYRKLSGNDCYDNKGELRWISFDIMPDNAIAIKLV